jgi:trk system potassium uptake protein
MKNNKDRYIHLDIIIYYTGWVVIGMAMLMIIPILTALGYQEWNAMLDFIICLAITLIVGFGFVIAGGRTKQMKAYVQWKHGYVIAAFSWLLLTFLCGIPYLLSGHTLSIVDACFDVMSGFTTTGVFVTQDIDHLSHSLNIWRHVLTFVGGQGMVVLALSFLVKETSGAYKIYVGEAKDIDLVPNVKGTAQIIWKISMVYLLLGTTVLWLVGISIGLKPFEALFHGLCIFASAWSTGGFSPNNQNMMYYHSFLYEMVTVIIMILGSLNFGLHYAIWKGKRKELFKNIETRSFFVTATIACILAALSLSKMYPDSVGSFRRVIYNILSAHTTTGFGNVYAKQFITEWGDFGVFIMVVIMLIGGSACSTAGGIKGLRVGIIGKSIVADVKKLLSSENKITVVKYHHIKDSILSDSVVRASGIILICYMVTFAIGVGLGTAYGYPLADSAFEAASVTGNVGLSSGITTATMPTVLKIYYIIAMYLGRLEFLSVFALVGTAIGGLKKLCSKKR